MVDLASSKATMAPTKAEIDMSPRAIEIRLEELRALYKLCTSLKQAGKAAEPSALEAKRSG